MVVGWALSATNHRHLPLRALEQVLRRAAPGPPAPHRPRQPVRERARQGRDGELVLDHAFELGDPFETHASAKAKLFDYVEVFYNQERRHSTLGYVSPAQFERAARIDKAAA
jgi:transposase InsO family protein